MSSAILDVEHLYIGYQGRRGRDYTLACADLDFTIDQGEFVAIVGPSGCGKTTFLQAVAGLVPIAEGRLALDGTPIAGPGRDRSLVFQDASLFPWRTVMQNVTFGLQAQGRLDDAGRQRARDLVELVGLTGHDHKRPGELSGGMRQRVNLARALATDPEVLLLDEPFAALDAQTRGVMQEELLRIWQSDGVTTGKTAVFITHDVAEAVFLADRVIVFSAGPASVAEIVDIDLPRPRTPDHKRDPAFLALSDRILDLVMAASAEKENDGHPSSATG